MKQLKEFRKGQKLTIKDFAESLGISNSLYAKVESGSRKPSRGFIEKIKIKYPSFDVNVFFNN